MFQRRSFASACLAGLCGVFGLFGRREAQASPPGERPLPAELVSSEPTAVMIYEIENLDGGSTYYSLYGRDSTPEEIAQKKADDAARLDKWHREHPPVPVNDVPAIVHELEAFIQDESNRDNIRGLAEILRRHL